MTTDLALSQTDTSTRPPTTDTTRLSWATSLFYFGMLAGLYPLTYLQQRFPLRVTLGPLILVWALTCMLTATVTTYRSLYAQRFFLGVVEAAIAPAFMCIVSGNYTQREQSVRQGWWFSATGWWAIIGGGLNYGFAQVGSGAGGSGLKGWQDIYLLAGALTAVFGVACFFVPDSPASAWFLTPEERFAAVERLRDGQTGVRCTQIKGAQVWEAVRDVKIWLVAVMMASA